MIEQAIKQIEELFNSDLTDYRISKDTGLTLSVIQNYRSGKYELENMSFKVAKKLIRYSEEIKMINKIKEFVGNENFEVTIELVYTDGHFQSSVDYLKTSDINEAVGDYKTVNNGSLLRYFECNHSLFLKSLNRNMLHIVAKYLTVKTETGRYKIIDEQHFDVENY